MESPDFGKEFRHYDVGLGGYLDTDVVARINASMYTPEKRFEISLYKAFEQIEKFYHISRELKDRILSYATTMNYMVFKNATAYILGYLAAKDCTDTKLSTAEVEKVFDMVPVFKDSEGIQKTDVLRYARFVMLGGDMSSANSSNNSSAV